MADFEGLIRQALARHNAADPEVRERVYLSSRNALARMIAAAGPQPIEAIDAQRRALENSIARIEAGYAAPARSPRVEPVAPAEPGFARPSNVRPDAARREPPQLRAEPAFGPPAAPEPVALDGPPEAYAAGPNPMLVRQSRVLPRILGFLAILVLFAIIGWFAWDRLSPLLLNPDAIVGGGKPVGSDPAEAAAAANASYIVILSPTDTASLVTSGRGNAKIVQQQDGDMLRLVSVRAADARDKPAEPFLISIRDGALREIAGRRVTVEIQAKSGGSGPVTFAIACEFAGADACGRKRFRLNLQPEAIVFTIEVPESLKEGGEANLAISTDVTNAAGVTGEGDAIDIAYARLRYQDR